MTGKNRTGRSTRRVHCSGSGIPLHFENTTPELSGPQHMVKLDTLSAACARHLLRDQFVVLLGQELLEHRIGIAQEQLPGHA